MSYAALKLREEYILRLLIVEDDEALQKLLTWEFEDLGYEVLGAASCKQAREAVETYEFDLALIDYHLPDGTGVELLKEFREQDAKMPIVMSSGLIGAETASRVVADHGAFEFVPKPVGARTLHQIFQNALSKQDK